MVVVVSINACADIYAMPPKRARVITPVWRVGGMAWVEPW